MLDDPEKARAALARLEAIKAQRLTENKISAYNPYPQQRAFHDAGATHDERMLMAANQVGKSLAQNMEVAIHATGLYPDWWKGYRFERAPRIWACGETGEVLRGTTQLLLLGDAGSHGTGCIPKAALLEVVPARGLADLADMIRVKHLSGGVSAIMLKSYSQGRERFQGATLDLCALDEEPPEDIFTEVKTRLNVTNGPLMMCFTPLKGMSNVVKRFILDKADNRIVIGMTLDDAAHYTEERKKEIIAQYPEHQRAARTKGIPTMGSGAVFPIDLDPLIVDPFECPGHWIRVGGIDFGWTHPSAFCELWWDRDKDVIYLVRTLRLKEQTPLQHVETVRGWRLRWQWPRDGRNATLAGAGEPLAAQYREAGLDMWHEL
jgi:phage terminase large subunit-like protein